MVNPFVPEFDGELQLKVPDDFVSRIKKRVDEGFLVKGHRSVRTNYAIRSESGDAVSVTGANMLTAYNVGLNNVHVRRAGPTTLRYHVSFWRWTFHAVAHGVLLGGILLICLATFPEMRDAIAAYSFGPVLFWSILLFFCVLWPWILTALHRPVAEKTLQRILREVMA